MRCCCYVIVATAASFLPGTRAWAGGAVASVPRGQQQHSRRSHAVAAAAATSVRMAEGVGQGGVYGRSM